MVQYTEVSLSELETKKVIDADGVKVGKIKDARFDEHGSTWFVLGGGFVDETLKKLHIRPEMDLLVPADWIESVGDHEIVLTRYVFQLESTCEEVWEKEKERLVAAATPSPDDRTASLRLKDPWVV